MRKKVIPGWGSRLHPNLVRQINYELKLLVDQLGTDVFTGELLIALYEFQHEIENHGYEEGKFYKVHIKNNYVLTSEIDNESVRKKK